MTAREKLINFRDEINKAVKLNAELENLISVNLFDYIRGNSVLKDEFFKRAGYFDSLAVDKDFAEIQEKLFEKIVNVLKLTNIIEIEKIQQELNEMNECNYKLMNWLKNNHINGAKFLTVTETYKALQNKSSYFSLKDARSLQSITTQNQINRQYKIVETVFGFIGSGIIKDDKVLSKKFKQAIEEYNKVWFEFNKAIFRTPLNLHIKEFEDFLLFCVATSQIEGYENYYNLRGLLSNNLNDIKKNSTIVINDLVEFGEDIAKTEGKFKRIQEIGDNKKSTKGKQGEKIKKITIIKKDNGKLLVAINGNEETREIKNYSKWWRIFMAEAAARDLKPETRTDVKEISKGMADYFNYNSDKCPIYMGGKYALTGIFIWKGIDTIINPDVKTEIVTEKQFLSRKERGKAKK